MIPLRITVSLFGLATAIGVSYIAMVGGLGSNSTLSTSNAKYATMIGLVYGAGLIFIMNLLPFRSAKQALKLTVIVMTGTHFLFGLGFMIWVAAIAMI